MNTARFSTAEQARAFALAGNATFTLVSAKTGARFTYRVRCPIDAETGKADRSIHFVSLLNGADNENDYAYLGCVRRGVFFHGGAKAKAGIDTPSVKAFSWTWQTLAKDLLPDTLEIWHEGRCGRCARKLTVPASIASGFGPDCIEAL